MARVCLIDDDIFVRDALSLGLEDAGFEVVAAPGAAAGLDLIRRDGIDIIVTDMNMPGAGGDQLIKEVRAQWPALPIIAISGAGVMDGRNTTAVATELGANATLIKPFRARELATLIERLLGAAPS